MLGRELHILIKSIVLHGGRRDKKELYVKIIEILQKKQGSLTDVELYNEIKKYYEDIGFIIFNKTLMRLEIKGIIHVFNLTKNKRGVELISNTTRR